MNVGRVIDNLFNDPDNKVYNTFEYQRTMVLFSLAWPDRLFLQGVYRLQHKRP